MPPRRGAGGKDCYRYLHVNDLLLAILCAAAARASAVSRVTCHVTVTQLYPDPGPSSQTVLVVVSSAAVVLGQYGTAEWMNYKSCVGRKPTRNGAQRTLPLQSAHRTRELRHGVMMLDTVSTSPVELLAWCCVAARICTITTTAQPRPGRGLRKFGFEQRSGIARPGATSPRAAPCQG